jgi:hypothetical protein
MSGRPEGVFQYSGSSPSVAGRVNTFSKGYHPVPRCQYTTIIHR